MLHDFSDGPVFRQPELFCSEFAAALHTLWVVRARRTLDYDGPRHAQDPAERDQVRHPLIHNRGAPAYPRYHQRV